MTATFTKSRAPDLPVRIWSWPAQNGGESDLFMAGQPGPPAGHVPPPEIAGLIIRAY